MKKKAPLTLIVILLFWCVIASMVDNPYIMPKPFDVFSLMFTQTRNASFYQAIAFTVYRSVSGLIIAFVLALVIGLLAGLHRRVEDLFSPIYLLTKSIPNISYILIALIWTNNETAVKIISFMILFPMFYSNIVSGIHQIDRDLIDVTKIYPEKWYRMIFRVYLPCIETYLLASLSNGMGLAFKVGVMAEILGSVSPGIGRQFQLCRIDSNMIGIFAWTIWIILILYLIEFLIKWIHRSISEILLNRKGTKFND